MIKKERIPGSNGAEHDEVARDINWQKRPPKRGGGEIQSRIALLIGVRDYVDPTCKKLPHTVYDVTELKKVLSGSGYIVRTLHSDLSGELKPTRENIWGELENIVKQTGPGDLLLVHFGGHGVIGEDNEAYLMPTNGRKASLARTAVNLEEFKKELASAGAQAKILLLDACHSGIGRGAAGMTPEFERLVFLEAEGTATLAACRRGEVAYEHDKTPHGVFTYYLLEGMRGAARREKLSFITFDDLKVYVTGAVKSWAKEKGFKQWPNAATQLAGDPALLVYQNGEIETKIEVLNKAPKKEITQKLSREDVGFKYFRYYSYIEYDHHPQNWGIAQNKNGIIYIANQGGMLEFDGVSWRVINVPNFIVRSLTVDDTGTIYVGGDNEIGFLRPDTKGSLKYVSLVDHLDDDLKNFSLVWRTHTAKEGIFFRTSKFLFRWDSKEITAWTANEFFRASFVCNGNLFIHQKKVGIMRVISNSLKLIPGSEIFAEDMIYLLAPYDTDPDSQRLLIGGRSKGFYMYDGKTIEPVLTKVADYLKENKASYGIRLSSGDFALATLRGGLVFMDNQGCLKYIFDKTSGLENEDVKYVYEDIWGDLWLSLDKGIARLEYNSPFLFYDQRSGLPGFVLSVVRHKGDIYAGTDNGLYVLRSHLKKFQPVSDISSRCWSLLSVDHSLLVATSEGVFEFVNENESDMKIVVIEDQAFTLSLSSRYPGRIWCGTNSGLVALLKKKDKWVVEQRFRNIDRPIRSITEDKNGHLWLITSTGDAIKAFFSANIHSLVGKSMYHTSHKLSEGAIFYVTRAAGDVIFASEKGIFRFVEKKKAFIPDPILGNHFTDGASRPVFRLTEDKNKNIWFHSRTKNYVAVPGAKGSFIIHFIPFHMTPATQVNAIYPDPNGKTIWFAGIDGLILYDTTVEKDYRQEFKTLIREVIINEKQVLGEKLLFDGYQDKTDNISSNLNTIIEHKERNLHFEFAAPFFQAESEKEYRFYLEGYERVWSAWTKDTKRNYTNLDPGKYTFRVQAKNVYEHLGAEGVFQFEVIPPLEEEERQKKQPSNFQIKSENPIKKIFLSYSHRDREFVKRLTIDLENAEMSIWVDEKQIKVGESISQKVEEAISDCDFFCLIISKNSFKSNWVKREYRTALNKQLSTGTVPKILPILIQDIEMPLLLKDIKYADFSKDYNRGMKQLLDATRETK